MHLRPRSFSELIDATFEIVRARFGALATTAAIIMVPVMAFTLLTVLGGGTTMPGETPVKPSAGAAALVGVLAFPVMLLAIVAYVVGFGALMYIASRAYLGEAVDVGPALAHARKRFWKLLRVTFAKYVRAVGPVILLGIIGAVAIPALAAGSGGGSGLAIGAMLLIPVAMVWSIVALLRYAVTAPIAINEDVPGGAVLARSAALTNGSKGRLFGLFLVLVVIMYAIMFTVMFGSMMIFKSLLLAQVLMNVTSLVTYPFAAVLVTVVYYDLRIRNEGFDLEVMAGGLTDAAVLPPAPAGTPSRQPA